MLRSINIVYTYVIANCDIGSLSVLNALFRQSLKYHPDRAQGSSKEKATERFQVQ